MHLKKWSIKNIFLKRNDQYTSATFVYFMWLICVVHKTLKTFTFTCHYYFEVLSLTHETSLILHLDHELWQFNQETYSQKTANPLSEENILFFVLFNEVLKRNKHKFTCNEGT